MPEKIISYLANVQKALDKQYSNLFDDDKLDMTVDMEAMTIAIKRDGLLDEDDFKKMEAAKEEAEKPAPEPTPEPEVTPQPEQKPEPEIQPEPTPEVPAEPETPAEDPMPEPPKFEEAPAPNFTMPGFEEPPKAPEPEIVERIEGEILDANGQPIEEVIATAVKEDDLVHQKWTDSENQ